MSGRDRISELPDSLITQILSYLPIKDSVKTSVLASSWKNHWLHVPVLKLNYRDFSSDGLFISFIDRFLNESLLQKLKVKNNIVEIEEFMDRIDTAIDRGIQHLDLKGCRYYRGVGRLYPYNEFMPLSIYTSKTLVSLKLSRLSLLYAGSVYLPCLKLMHLQKLRWVAPMTLEILLSGCPVLEELTLRRDLRSDTEVYHNEPVVMRIWSRNLRRFCVPSTRRCHNSSTQKYVLDIDAPELEYMSLKEDHFDTNVVEHLTSLFTIDLDIKFAIDFGAVFDPEDLSKRNEIHDFLIGITSVRHMIISLKTVKTLDRYSKVGLIPKFNNLSRLQAVFPRFSLQLFPALLESCPNLKHLIYKIDYSTETEAFEVINVPRCFVSTLECVEIEGLLDWEEEELKTASYFLENAAVLKELILQFSYLSYPRVSDSDIYEELYRLTKPSRGCGILIDYENYE